MKKLTILTILTAILIILFLLFCIFSCSDTKVKEIEVPVIKYKFDTIKINILSEQQKAGLQAVLDSLSKYKQIQYEFKTVNDTDQVIIIKELVNIRDSIILKYIDFPVLTYKDTVKIFDTLYWIDSSGIVKYKIICLDSLDFKAFIAEREKFEQLKVNFLVFMDSSIKAENKKIFALRDSIVKLHIYNNMYFENNGNEMQIESISFDPVNDKPVIKFK